MSTQFVRAFGAPQPFAADADGVPAGESFGTLEGLFAAGARGMVAAQQALDERGRASLLEWETEGMPPTVWTCANCRLAFPAAFRFGPKSAASEATRVGVAPRDNARGGVSLSFRYVLTPQEEV
jgi:hypothetical protein